MQHIKEQNRPAGVSPSFNTWLICAVCFLIITVDGFDTAAIAYVAPALTHLWHIPQAAMTPAFISTSLGAVVGYLSTGTLARVTPRRTVIMVAMLAFGGLSLLTIESNSIPAISAIRFLTTFCLGIVVPTAISIAADNASDNARASVTIVATTGLSAGAALGGFASVKLITAYGWKSVFIAGGVAPMLLLPLVWYALPGVRTQPGTTNVPVQTATWSPRFAEVRSLFAPTFFLHTVTVWLVAFFGFLVTYLFIFWTPILLLSYGFSSSSAPVGAAANALGGIAGNVLLLLLVKRLGLRRSLVITLAIAMLCIVGFQLEGLSRWTVLLLIFGIGAGSASACVGQSTLATVLYPASLRTTSVGYGAAIGRLGAILGPSVGGLLISLGFSTQRIVLISCIPFAVVEIVLLASQMCSSAKERALEARGF
ncbi:MFS transporter [Paraburkholderia ferrariae]|uniref:MFS transporter n=1 Tax=Paraburkholderia ferrariae TaxID=386056 RepID=UPI000A054480|nr:MFS transporter [Paraburkholderia ferrariae]